MPERSTNTLPQGIEGKETIRDKLLTILTRTIAMIIQGRGKPKNGSNRHSPS